jgi:RimJ/RimL family protein N-acetyltransferase
MTIRARTRPRAANLRPVLDQPQYSFVPARPLSPPIQRQPLSDPWTERLVMGDGRQLLLRPICPADAEPLRQGFSLLHPEEVRMRFMYTMKELSPEMAQRLSTLDSRRDFALVAAEPLPPGEALITSVVRASIDEGSRSAEFAILVSHYVAGQGLGQLLMKRIIRWARLKRLDEIYGDVLEDNTAMLKLAESLGFTREHRLPDPGVVRVRLVLRPTDIKPHRAAR